MPRRHTRFPVLAEARCRWRNEAFPAKATNISYGGVFLESQLALPVGGRVNVWIGLAAGQVEAVGRVAWTFDVWAWQGEHAPGSGIEFLQLGPHSLAALGRSIRGLGDGLK